MSRAPPLLLSALSLSRSTPLPSTKSSFSPRTLALQVSSDSLSFLVHALALSTPFEHIFFIAVSVPGFFFLLLLCVPWCSSAVLVQLPIHPSLGANGECSLNQTIPLQSFGAGVFRTHLLLLARSTRSAPTLRKRCSDFLLLFLLSLILLSSCLSWLVCAWCG